MIQEDIFFDLLLQSEKPAGFKIKLWVTRDIIPAIRKHGVYAHLAAHFIKHPDALPS